MKSIYRGSKLAVILFVSLLATACKENKGVVLVDENFEGTPPTELIGKHAKIIETTPISGKKSLECEGVNGRTEIFRYTTDKYNFFEVSYTYQLTDNSKYNSLVIDLEDGDGNLVERRKERFFMRKKGSVESGRCVFHSKSGKKFSVVFKISAKRKVILDDVKIVGFNVSPKSDWAVGDVALETCRNNPFSNHYLKLNDKYLSMNRDEFFPFIDKWGQFKHRQWQDKINSDADLKTRLVEEKTWLEKNPAIEGRDKYLGYIDPNHKYEATGKFRTQKVDGKWFFVTPEGNLFYVNGVTTLGWNCLFDMPKFDFRENETPTRVTAFEGREEIFEDLNGEQYIIPTKSFQGIDKVQRAYYKDEAKSFDFYARNVDLKYGKRDRKELVDVLAKRVKSFGLNLGGHLSEGGILREAKIPYTVTAMSRPNEWIDGKIRLYGWWQLPPDWFSPNFEKSVKESLAQKADLIKSPYCFGVFIDGELPWQTNKMDLAKGVLSCKPTQSAKKKFRDVLKEKYKNIDALNSAWEANYKSFDDFLNTDDFIPKTKAGEADLLEFDTIYIRQYFKVCRDAIKAIDPKAMYLGCSFGTTGEAVAVSAEYCEVVTLNIYSYSQSKTALPQESKDRPIIIGEYHFTPQDRGTFGISMIAVGSTENQAKYTKEFMKSCLNNPNVAGAVWFEWTDLPTTGRYDTADSGIGIIDIADTPNYPLVEAFRDISKSMYKERLNSKTKYDTKSSQENRNWL